MDHLENRLCAILAEAPEIEETLAACAGQKLPQHYLAGGAVTQIVWNNLTGRPMLGRIKDFDIVYFADEAMAQEALWQLKISQRVRHGIPLDIKNQFHVHRWYHEKFGHVISPYDSAEAGIASWLPAFAVGVRDVGKGLEIYAPFGLEDLFAMHVRPNKTVMSRENYLAMVGSFQSRWPEITVEPW